MATGLQARFTAATDPIYLERVAQALVEVAVSVYNETPQPTNHQARANYAVLVATDPPLSMVANGADGIMQPDKRTYAVARLLTTQGIDGNSTDAAIITAVGNVWNALAGA